MHVENDSQRYKFRVGQTVDYLDSSGGIKESIITDVLAKKQGDVLYRIDIKDTSNTTTVALESQLFPPIMQSGRELVELCNNSLSASDFIGRAIGDFNIDKRSASLIYQTIKVIKFTSSQYNPEYIMAYREGFLAYEKDKNYNNPYPEDGVSNSYLMCVHEMGGNCLENLAFENGYFDANGISEHDEK